MAFYVKGDPIANATGYGLYKKIGDSYHRVDVKLVNDTLAKNDGYITAQGIPGGGYGKYYFSDFISVNQLPKDADVCTVSGVCRVSQYASADHSSLITFKDYGNSSLEAEDATGTTIDAATLTQSLSEETKFVVFSGVETMSITYNEISFCLDDYTETLPAGETHQLVVKAIAPTEGVDTDEDGKIDLYYEDSEYGGDVNGTPLIYIPNIDLSNITLLSNTPTVDTYYSLAKNAYIANMGYTIDANTFISHIDLPVTRNNVFVTEEGVVVQNVSLWVFDASTNLMKEKLINNQNCETIYSEALNKYVVRLTVNRAFSYECYFGFACDRVEGVAITYYGDGTGFCSGSEFNGTTPLVATKDFAVSSYVYGVSN